MGDRRRLLEAVLRQDLSAFIAKVFGTVVPGVSYRPNWHIEAIADRLEAVRQGRIQRLLITMPPRSLKSVAASVAFPAFVIGHDPTRRVVCVSYAEDLAARHARDCRAVMQADWYRAVFPKTRLLGSRPSELDFETTRRGGRLSVSTGGALTGRGGSLIIIDDPQKPIDALSETRRATTRDWFRNTLLSRLDDKARDAIVLVMQRLHEDDLAGAVLEQGGWSVLSLPAIAPADETIAIGPGRVHQRQAGDALHPAREPLEVLQRLKQEMGTFTFSAQYLQAPIPEEGNLVKRDWLVSDDTPPDGGRVLQSWDFAVKEGEETDYTVCITARQVGRTITILDVFREKLDYPAQRSAVLRLARTHGASVLLIERAANGSPLVADLRHLAAPDIPTPIAVTPRGSKRERLAVQSHRIEAGDLRLPRAAPWLDDFIAELLAFPNGRHDDQVDALTQLLDWTSRQDHRPSAGLAAPILIYGDRARD